MDLGQTNDHKSIPNDSHPVDAHDYNLVIDSNILSEGGDMANKFMFKFKHNQKNLN